MDRVASGAATNRWYGDSTRVVRTVASALCTLRDGGPLLTRWIGNLHVGQMIMLELLYVLAFLVFSGVAISYYGNYQQAESALTRITDHAGYTSKGEQGLSNADLWEKKVKRDYFSESDASAYVALRPGYTGDSMVSDAARAAKSQHRDDTHRNQSIWWLFAVLAGRMLVKLFMVPWIWFGARRPRPQDSADGADTSRDERGGRHDRRERR